MPELATYTGVFRANTEHRAKRNRQPISCTTCQRRKTRCDRQQPCHACLQRGDPDQCRFGPIVGESAPTEKKKGGTAVKGNGRREVQARLNKLEHLVKELASSNEKNFRKRSRDDGDEQCEAQDEGRDQDGRGTALHVDRTDDDYQGATSWSSLVANIRDIQHLLDTEDDGEAEDTEASFSSSKHAPRLDNSPGMPQCFLVSPTKITLDQILKALPPRQDSDKLVATFFKAKFVAIPFIHVHQFRRQYDAFWEDPSSATYLWVSILFSVLSLGIALIKYSPNMTVSSQTDVSGPQKYLILAAQCFIAGEYFRARPLSVEALLMHAHARNTCLVESNPSVWTFYGLAIRIAQRQGYHREMTKVSAQATPFAAEMRRRTWFMLRAMDLLHSLQQGMPPMTDPALCDTQAPSNLTDEDFDEDTVILPRPRDTTDPTPILAYITKELLCSILDRVLRLALTTGTRLYPDVLALHAELEAWHESIPACYRIRPIKSTSFTDPNHTIMHRIMLETLYLKTLCILHREYLGHEMRRNPQFQTSAHACKLAAEKLIEIHIELDGEIQPGGRLYEDRYMVNSLTLHDFLVAAMILCVELSETKPEPTNSDRMNQVRMLRSATCIWERRSQTSRDALHATRILKAILQRVDSLPSATSSHFHTPETSRSVDSGGKFTSYESTYDAHEWHTNPGNDNFMFDSFTSENTDLDWPSIDEFLRTGNSDIAYWAPDNSGGASATTRDGVENYLIG
ncbi:hypothetical protein NLU13_7514 [Sarocladium strictum]|uniref:Zn(2)-C6 fungal-type domain-containing protein n=1 Tax=Sarocladium strictum TaxID=5046 RepID=A0AA39L598_SARSR|nr:hypothetical protein NLU13_7514 [Sarocladium strictum]